MHTSMIFILLIVFQIKHFLADFPLQNAYMLGKFKGGRDWILPLIAHAGVHALFSIVIALAFGAGRMSLLIGLIDFVIHFVVDRIKASPQMLGRYKTLSAGEFPTATAVQKANNTYFWWALGADQMMHHLTHYGLIALILWTR